ncbi:MAG TPA: restriction endonuclease [Actinocrinis sp.]|uniref:restriction endonuclease n=1 Tax=Actinocrinis sp. TaxID=1920516 RepID=UPI002DDD7784|nr:restriction endonuclease [Actinocrinis sp.]HEV3169946.1 restriction endonuclease [Actinocrinis sp.]
MARKKSIIAEFLRLKQEKEKARAQQARMELQEEIRAQKLEEQRQRQAQRKRDQAAKARNVRAAEELRARRSGEAAQREVERIQREAERREQERQRQEAAQQRAKQAEARRKAAEQAKALEMARRHEAGERSAQIRIQLAQFDALLQSVSSGLHSARLPLERAFDNGDLITAIDVVERTLTSCPYPAGVAGPVRAQMIPEARELIMDVELPPRDTVPAVAEYRYVASRREIVPVARKLIERDALYRLLIARVALRRLHEAFTVCPPSLIDSVVFNGHVSAKNPATGRPIRPCVLSVQATRALMDEMDLCEPELDPAACLHHLNAIFSKHPGDLEPVQPVVVFDARRYRFVDAIDVVAGLDSRPEILNLTPTEFEHLVRRLFEAYGLQAWVTQASRDDGVDAVAFNKDPFTGGTCVIQAKRYTKVVPANDVRALAGVMDDMNATKGILVTTSWFGKTSRDFATRNGRMQLIDARELIALLKTHLNLDALITLPKPPREWTP